MRQVQKPDVRPLKIIEDYFAGKSVPGIDAPGVVKTSSKDASVSSSK